MAKLLSINPLWARVAALLRPDLRRLKATILRCWTGLPRQHPTDADGATCPGIVEGAFIAGEPIHLSDGFHEKTDAQVCVRTLVCIMGVLRVPPATYA